MSKPFSLRKTNFSLAIISSRTPFSSIPGSISFPVSSSIWNFSQKCFHFSTDSICLKMFECYFYIPLFCLRWSNSGYPVAGTFPTISEICFWEVFLWGNALSQTLQLSWFWSQSTLCCVSLACEFVDEPFGCKHSRTLVQFSQRLSFLWQTYGTPGGAWSSFSGWNLFHIPVCSKRLILYVTEFTGSLTLC